jgi:hypothetical protein
MELSLIKKKDKKKDKKKGIKIAIWLYFFLLIFEGSFRKWIIPSLSNEILVIRDPVAIIILFLALKKEMIPKKIIITAIITIGLLSFFTAILAGHGSIIVALFGVRPFIIHLPLAFVIGSVFDKSDVIKIGKTMMYLLVLMTILLIIQFYSPQSAWVNKGVGGDLEGSGFGGALGFYRSSGTFSFINGLTLFYGLASAYLFYFIFHSKYLNGFILTSCIIATALSIPFTISRTVLFQNILCFFFLLIVVLKNPKYLKNIVPIALLLVVFIFIFAKNEYIVTAIDAFTSRFEDANDTEGGLKGSLIDRMFGTLINAVISSIDESLIGQGIGTYSNVGVQTLNVRNTSRIADYEWSRIISEMGAIMGIIFIFLRIRILVYVFIKSLKKIKQNDYLPWMLLSFGFMLILQGQIAQPTSLGFLTITLGLILASFNKEINSNLLLNRK